MTYRDAGTRDPVYEQEEQEMFVQLKAMCDLAMERAAAQGVFTLCLEQERKWSES